MEKDILEYVGRSLYHMDILKEKKRYLVFRFRCTVHKQIVEGLLDFFNASDARRAILKGTPSFVEQVTRSFFYKDSTWKERVGLVEQHLLIMEELFSPELLAELYASGNKIQLWQDSYLDKPLTLNLFFNPGQRKEGCLSLVLEYEGEELYQIMFWFGKVMSGEGNAIYIGALQGHPNASKLIKGLTKAYFGYRTKNLIFYGLRCLARALGMKEIYAVTNEGYYAMNHMRMDRKLKTDFATFWQECEGKPSADKRFYVMPVAEYRKSMEELKPSKRAQHRRRFAKMDEMKTAVAKVVGKYRK